MHVFTMFDIGVSMILVWNEHKRGKKCNPVLAFDSYGNETPNQLNFLAFDIVDSGISMHRYL